MNLSRTHKAIWALIIANFIWGAAPPLFKWSLENIPPFTLAFFRYGLGALIFLPFCYRNLKIYKSDYVSYFLLAFFGITINISFFFLALLKTDSINAPIIASSAPLFIIASSILFLKEKVGTKKIIGGLIGLAGVLVIILLPALGKILSADRQGFDGSIEGNLFIILSTVGGIIHLLIAKELAKKYGVSTIIWWMFAIGAATFVPLMVWEVQTTGFLVNLNIQGITGILYGAILATVIANYLYLYAIKMLQASEVGMFVYLDPIIAIIIAIPLLGEIPSPLYVLGSLLVFGGIYIAEGRIHYHPFHKLKSG